MKNEAIISTAMRIDPFGADGTLYKLASNSPETLAAFVAAFVADEREACARTCEGISHMASSNAPVLCAMKIRARSRHAALTHPAPPASQEQAQQPSSDRCAGCGQPTMHQTVMNCKTPSRCGTTLKQQPSGGEVVTRESALEAIEHVEQYNGPGRAAEARRMLATPKPEPMTDEQHEALMRGRSTLDYGRAVEAHHGITKGEA